MKVIINKAVREKIKLAGNPKNVQRVTGTTWEIYSTKNKEIREERGATACFAQTNALINTLAYSKKYVDRLVYKLHPQASSLSIKEKIKWVSVLKKEGILKQRTGAKRIIESGAVFNIADKNLSPSMLYLRLALLRYINEEPRTVLAAMELYDAGVPFALCIGYAQMLHGQNSNHMLFSFGYGVHTPEAKAKIGLRKFLGLHFFLKDNGSKDKRPYLTKNGMPQSWRIFSTIEEYEPFIALSEENKDALFDERVLELFECKTNEEVKTKIKESKERGEKIFV